MRPLVPRGWAKEKGIYDSRNHRRDKPEREPDECPTCGFPRLKPAILSDGPRDYGPCVDPYHTGFSK